MNASQIQSVPTTWHAGMKNVLTLVKTAQSMLTAQPEITELYASVGLATQEIHTAQFAAKVSTKTLFFDNLGIFFKTILSVQQFRYQRLNVQQTKTALAGKPVCRKNAKIPARQYLPVPATQNAQFTTPFHSELCPAPAYQGTQEKEMSAVRKSVSKQLKSWIFCQEITNSFFLHSQQSYLNLLVVNQTKSAQEMRLAILEIVPIHVSPQIHAAPTQPAM